MIFNQFKDQKIKIFKNIMNYVGGTDALGSPAPYGVLDQSNRKWSS